MKTKELVVSVIVCVCVYVCARVCVCVNVYMFREAVFILRFHQPEENVCACTHADC